MPLFRSELPVCDRTTLVDCKRRAAASASETETARRCAAALRRCEPGKGFPVVISSAGGCYA
jgi:hypothetical protein